MVMPFQNALQGIQQRFQTMQTPGSAFQSPFGTGTSPFAATGGFGGGGSPFGNPFGQGSNPFGNSPFGAGGSPFGNPFGAGANPFGGSPFGAGGNPFSGQPWGSIANPYQGTDNDPFGTGKGATGNKPGSDTTTFGGGDGSNFTPSTFTGQQAQSWVQGQRGDSPLVPITPQIVEYARSRGVDPGMLFGILKSESQFAADGSLGVRQNNPGNIGGAGNLHSYATMLDGVKAMVDLLASYGETYGATTVEAMIATYYVGPQAYARYGLEANDAGGQGAGGNGTVRDYLEKKVYPTMQAFGAQRQSTASANRGNWEQVAKSFTREGGSWVDYTNGGIRITGNPKDGFDCSSFTGYVLGLDKSLWIAQNQADAARQRGTFSTNRGQMQKGDLVFFTGTDPSNNQPVTHVGLYLGNGKMIHTGTPGRGVEIVDLNTPYWQTHYYGSGRL